MRRRVRMPTQPANSDWAARSDLASDELEGRGVGTQGLDQAAQYIAGQFAAAGLNTKLFEGTPFQRFKMTTGAELGTKNEVALVAPGKDGQPNTVLSLKLKVDFNPSALGGSASSTYRWYLSATASPTRMTNTTTTPT